MTDLTLTQRSSTLWTDRERTILGAVANLLIPATDDMPAATTVDVPGVGIDEVGRLRPDLVAAAKAVVGIIGDHVPDHVDDLRALTGGHFAGVSELLASAYFLRPEVARLIGYRQRLAIPLDDESTRSAEFAELVAPVISRGNVWRSSIG